MKVNICYLQKYISVNMDSAAAMLYEGLTWSSAILYPGESYWSSQDRGLLFRFGGRKEVFGGGKKNGQREQEGGGLGSQAKEWSQHRTRT